MPVVYEGKIMKQGDRSLDRRAALAAMAGSAAMVAAAQPASAMSAAVRAGASATKGLKIASIETFDVHIPQPASILSKPQPHRGGTRGRINVVRVTTNGGITGYSFLVSSTGDVAAANIALAGQDLLAVDAHLQRGLGKWPAIEEAIWDAIGKTLKQPVSQLLGGIGLARLPVYLTYVWPGPADALDPQLQIRHAAVIRNAGFKAMKIQMFRTDSQRDADTCAAMLASVDAGFRVMVDRTAVARGLWSFEQGLMAAQALQKAGVYWLEEPFARDDYDSPARLREMVDILITGGEGWGGTEPFKRALTRGTFDIVQPELRTVAGIAMMRRIGVLADAWNVPVAPHAAVGLAIAGRVQSSAALGAVYQEIGPFTPTYLPDDVCAPFLPILHGVQPFMFEDGEMVVPQSPGLGLNVDDAALNRFRVSGYERVGPGTGPPPSLP